MHRIVALLFTMYFAKKAFLAYFCGKILNHNMEIVLAMLDLILAKSRQTREEKRIHMSKSSLFSPVLPPEKKIKHF